MFGKNKTELIELMNSFRLLISSEIIDEVIENIEFNECGLAIELLSDWIYELNISVSPFQQSEILRLSKDCGVDENYHSFVGKTPPNPDLQTEEDKKVENRMSIPTLENIKFLASKGFKICAVKMHRELFGSELKEAIVKVEEFEKIK